jgi:hypothetical protein
MIEVAGDTTDLSMCTLYDFPGHRSKGRSAQEEDA